MTKHDLEHALEQQVSGTHLSDEALRNIRAAVYKEEKPVKRKMNVALALVLALVMLSATALAAGGVLERIARLKGTDTPVLPGGEALFQDGSGPWQDGLVTYRVIGSTYDGRAAGVVIEITPRVEDTLILSSTCVALKCWERGSKPCVPPIKPLPEGELDDPILRYARENGYRQVALVDASVNGFMGGFFYSEWKDNRITMFYTVPSEADTISGAYSLRSALYPSSAMEHPQWSSLEESFTLTAPDPLWATDVRLEEPLPVPEYGVAIDRVSLTGTQLGVYADVHCTVENRVLASRTLVVGVDETGEFLGYGLLETGSTEVAFDAVTHTYPASLPPMAEMPETLRLKFYDAGGARTPVTVALPLK